MRVAIFDPWAYTTSWALRLQAEGCDVLVYLGTEDPVLHVGDGLYPKERSYEKWAAWAREVPRETIVLFCASDYG